MTTKVLSGTYPSGYYAPASVNAVSVTATGVVKGAGLGAAGALNLTNSGKIAGDAGVAGATTGAAGGAGNNGVTLESGRVTNEGLIAAGGGGAGAAGTYYGGEGGAGGVGVDLQQSGLVVNRSTVRGGDGGAAGGAYGFGVTQKGGIGGVGGVGVDLQRGGTLVNSSTIKGGAGAVGGYGYERGGDAGAAAAAVLLGASATITNSGLMQGGAGALGGPRGEYGPGANSGGGAGLLGSAGTFTLNNSGIIVGGAATPGTSGGTGVDLAAGSVVNTGVVRAGQSATYNGGPGGIGVVLRGNGAVSNYGGTITGGMGGAGTHAPAVRPGLTGGVGVDLLGGGTLSNSGLIQGGGGGQGGANDLRLLSPGQGGAGAIAVSLGATGSILNRGTIIGGAGGVGGAGSRHSNGGLGGVGGAAVTLAASGSIVNQGTIQGGSGGVGGSVNYHGTTAGTGGAGGAAVILGGSGTVTNLRSIIGGAGGAAGRHVTGATPGTAGAAGDGILLSAGGAVVNGDATHTHARISGGIGVDVTGTAAVTVTNYGTIQGSVAAVQFASAADHLIAMSGADFIGGMKGGGGTLELDGGTVAISRIGGGGVLSGDDHGSFSGFATYEFDAGGDWTAAGVNLAAGSLARDAGALTIAGDVTLAAGSQLQAANGGVIEVGAGATVTSAGKILAGAAGKIVIQDGVDNTGKLITQGGHLTITGDVTGAGSANIQGGVLRVDGAFSENVAFVGADPSGTLALKHATAYDGKVSGFSTDGQTTLDLLDVGFTSSSEASFSGSSAGGVLTVSDGTNTAKINLKGDFVGDTFTAKSDGHGGVIVTASGPSASAATAPLVQAHANFAVSSDPPLSTGPPPVEPANAVLTKFDGAPTHLSTPGGGAGHDVGLGHDQFIFDALGAVDLGAWLSGHTHLLQDAQIGSDWAFH